MSRTCAPANCCPTPPSASIRLPGLRTTRRFFYSTEDAQTKRSDLVHRHVLGTDSASDPIVFNEKDERYDVYVTRTRDDKYLLMAAKATSPARFAFFPAKTPDGDWQMIEPRNENVRYSVDEGNGLFYIRVNDTDPSYRVVTAPVATPDKAHWTELIAARKDVPLDDIDVFNDFYVVTERVKGLPVLQVISGKTNEKHAIEVPEPAYELGASVNVEFDTDKYRYNYQSPITPNSTFEYDVKTRESTLLKQQEVPGGYDKTRYASSAFSFRQETASAFPPPSCTAKTCSRVAKTRSMSTDTALTASSSPTRFQPTFCRCLIAASSRLLLTSGAAASSVKPGTMPGK